MQFGTTMESILATLGDTLPSLIAAVAILVVGWLVAVVLRAGTRRLLDAANLNERIASSTDSEVDAESWGAKGVFWIVMFLVLIAFFNVLDLEIVSQPLGACDKGVRLWTQLVRGCRTCLDRLGPGQCHSYARDDCAVKNLD